jgi:hypothetical protein
MMEQGEQGSADWLMARVGYCTASRFKDVMDTLKSGKPGAKRTNYLWELVAERLTGNPTSHYTSTAMMHGTEHEPLARMAYEAKTGRMVAETGFRHHLTIPMVGGSPDGLVGDDGGIEIKCPFNSMNHLLTIRDGMPEEHIPQVQGLMWLLGRQWWDFVSYDPRMPKGLDLYVQRIDADKDFHAALEAAIVVFTDEVAKETAHFESIREKVTL